MQSVKTNHHIGAQNAGKPSADDTVKAMKRSCAQREKHAADDKKRRQNPEDRYAQMHHAQSAIKRSR